MAEQVYLDHAATSSPKPPAVAERVRRYLAEDSLSAGRGSYRRAEQIAREILATRTALARLLGAESAERIVFTGGGTEALNLVLQGLLQPGQHVVATELEHNSVLRPLAWLRKQRGISVTYIPPDDQGRVDPQAMTNAFRPETRLVCCLHASNVTGALQPVTEICQRARAAGVLSLVDAAQTVGHWPVDVQEMGCDFLATPAHKGLLGPLGVGVLYVATGREGELAPLILGGTGTRSEQEEPPTEMPARYEAGSLNVPGLLGLGAALKTVTPEFVQQEAERQQELTQSLLARLRDIPGLVLHADEIPPAERIGVISLSLPGQDPRVLENILDAHFQVETRGGLHCAPRTHAWLGTAPQGGTLRLSLGHSTTPAHLDHVTHALQQLASQLPTF